MAQVGFAESAAAAGLDQVGFNYGAAVADYDGDGWEDLFATRLNTGGELYRNLGAHQFEAVTAEAGLVISPTVQFAAWGDFNNDGWPDLFLGARDEGNTLYLNNQDGSFQDVTLAAGVTVGSKVKALLLSDVNRDGWLDIYIARLGLENILYRNNGDGTFTNVVFQSGATDALISMGAIFFDFDNDGDDDLYLTHDANIPNILYRNNGNGQFTNVSSGSGANIAAMGMGVDAGDINNDGFLDLYVTNLGYNNLLLNNGNGTFTDITASAGVGDPGMGWGCVFLDADNDGWQDIYLVNDSKFSPFPNLLYRNNGDLTFSVVSGGTPLHSMEAGYGVVAFDADQDGREDLYLANYGAQTANQYFINETQGENRWLQLALTGEASNRTAVGARAYVHAGGSVRTDAVVAGFGWASQSSPVLHFGLGQSDTVELLTIHWPSGWVDSFPQVPANQRLFVTEGDSYQPPVSVSRSVGSEILRWEAGTASEGGSVWISIASRNAISSLDVRLMDLQGRTFRFDRYRNLPAGWMGKIEFPVEGIPTGLYLLSLRTDDRLETRRVFLR